MDKRTKYMLLAKSRQIFQWNPERRAAKKRAQLAPGIFTCEGCFNLIANEDASEADKLRFSLALEGTEDLLIEGKEAVDHIEPVIEPSEGFSGWDECYRRLFVKATGLQVLCPPCHYIKTQVENDERREKK